MAYEVELQQDGTSSPFTGTNHCNDKRECVQDLLCNNTYSLLCVYSVVILVTLISLDKSHFLINYIG